ncbi:MAG: glycosyltransferase family 2 protein [Parcubacteria group bacterium]|nr:glycosyltransferase family 2 protein [Parcubacteria group bacterium]
MVGRLEIILNSNSGENDSSLKIKKKEVMKMEERMKMKPNIVVIVPAHNEESVIEKTIYDLLKQTLPVNIIVVADNCTDQTVLLVKKMQESYPTVNLMETVNNMHRKAGAINQALRTLVGKEIDAVLLMDADTRINSEAVKEGWKTLSSNPQLAAVCSIAGTLEYQGYNPWKWLLYTLQKLEYAMFDSQRVETLDRIKVVHGMAALHRWTALQQVGFYDEGNLVEDYELTIRYKEKGWKVTVNLDMRAWTDVPLSLKALWKQRLRWLRGGVDSLCEHGWNKATRGDILNHFLFVFLTVIQTYLLILIFIMLSKNIPWRINPWLIGVISLGYLDGLYRLKYVKNLKGGDLIVRISLIPEILYGWFQAVVMLYAYYLSFAKINQNW